MAHDEGQLCGWAPKKPAGLFARLLWWLDSKMVSWAPAPHGNECEICKNYFNMDDIGIRPVKPWPPPPDDARFRMGMDWDVNGEIES